MEAGRRRRTALERRHLSARACSFFGADAFGAVVSSAAGHVDVGVGVEEVIGRCDKVCCQR
jgi:hypothetical protein